MYLSGPADKVAKRAAKQQARQARKAAQQQLRIAQKAARQERHLVAKAAKRQRRATRQQFRSGLLPVTGPAPVETAPVTQALPSYDDSAPTPFTSEPVFSSAGGGGAPVASFTDSSGNAVDVNAVDESSGEPGADAPAIPPIALIGVALVAGYFLFLRKGR